MEIYSAISNSWESNSYLIYDDKNCLLVDPNLQDNGIEQIIKEKHLNLKAVCCTHGHFDHISGVDYYVNKYKCGFYISEKDVEMLTDPYKNSSKVFGLNVVCNSKPTRLFKRFDILTDLTGFINVISTPYHTQGGVCLIVLQLKTMLSGDSLFKGGTGRTDLYGGNSEQIHDTLKKLSRLPMWLKVLPGHGPETTIADEFGN